MRGALVDVIVLDSLSLPRVYMHVYFLSLSNREPNVLIVLQDNLGDKITEILRNPWDLVL